MSKNYLLRLGLITMVIAFLMPLLPKAALAADLTCANCHNKPNADPAKFQLPSYYDGSGTGSVVDKANTCQKCHKPYWLSHQGASLVAVSVYGTVYGSFKAKDSIYSPASSIHQRHNNFRSSNYSTCTTCHGVVSCNACHATATKPVPHEQHYTGTAINPITGSPIGTPQIKSALGGNQPTTLATTCAANECHQTLPTPKLETINNRELCYNCHNTGQSGHDAVAIHTTKFSLNPTMDCLQCHKSDLASEHMNRRDSSNKPYDCLTCHKNTRTDVVLAIKNNLTDCDGCHSKADHLATHANALDSNCQTCHRNNLVLEHQNRNFNCETCHQNPQAKAAISAADIQCTACHNQGHNLNMVSKIPEDIPLLAGFEWSIPQPAKIWAGEFWLDQAYVESGKIVISNRRKDIKGQDVRGYYETELANSGWTKLSNQPPPKEDFFKLEFAKNARKLTVWFYGGGNHSSETVSSATYRVELVYK